MSLSHIERLYIENRDYIDNASYEELEMLVSSFLYQEILSNTITEQDLKDEFSFYDPLNVYLFKDVYLKKNHYLMFQIVIIVLIVMN